MGFVLHQRLAADTLAVGELGLSRVLMMNDARYPWVILVPRVAGLRELHELDREVRIRLQDESCAVAGYLVQRFAPVKLNIASLGNLVSQYHLHHVVRYDDDPAWPGPVWGHSPAVPYTAEAARERLSDLRCGLGL